MGGIETSRLSKGKTRASQTVGAPALYERLLRADARAFGQSRSVGTEGWVK